MPLFAGRFQRKMMQSFLHSAKIGRAPEICLVYTRTRLGMGGFSISRLPSFSREFAHAGDAAESDTVVCAGTRRASSSINQSVTFV
jgi:hypothetical protein